MREPDEMPTSSSEDSTKSRFSWAGFFSGGGYCRPIPPNSIACDLCGERVPAEEYPDHRRTRGHLEKRVKWERLQDESEDAEWIRNEIRYLASSRDVLRPKFGFGASKVTATQDRGVQGPTCCRSDERVGESAYLTKEDGFERADEIEAGSFYIKRNIHPGYDKCTDNHLYDMVKRNGGSAEEAERLAGQSEAGEDTRLSEIREKGAALYAYIEQSRTYVWLRVGE